MSHTPLSLSALTIGFPARRESEQQRQEKPSSSLSHLAGERVGEGWVGVEVGLA